MMEESLFRFTFNEGGAELCKGQEIEENSNKSAPEMIPGIVPDTLDRIAKCP